MGEFDDFASQMQGDHEARAKAHADKLQQEADARHTEWAVQKAKLESEVMPLANEAAKAFQSKGLRVELNPNWLGHQIMAPQITFQVIGQVKRPHDDSTYESGGDTVTIRVEDDGYKISARQSGHRKREADVFGTDIDAVRASLKVALQSFYDVADPARS